MAPAELDLQLIRQIAVDIAQEAGVLLRKGASDRFGTRQKNDTGDLVTTLDTAAEYLIVNRLRTAFPNHRVVAEESGIHGGDQGWTWLVDPLDGTNNVAIGLSTYVVGLALCVDERPVLGVVHDPVTDRTWSAVAGRGALGPDGTLRARRPSTPHGPVLGWTQGHGVNRHEVAACSLRLVLERYARRLLQLWAPLLCWVMLARGDIDGFIGYRAEFIDLPAGRLIATESGIAVVTLDGSPFDEATCDPAHRSFVAGHPDSVPELLRLVHAAKSIESRLLVIGNATEAGMFPPEVPFH